MNMTIGVTKVIALSFQEVCHWISHIRISHHLNYEIVSYLAYVDGPTCHMIQTVSYHASCSSIYCIVDYSLIRVIGCVFFSSSSLVMM